MTEHHFNESVNKLTEKYGKDIDATYFKDEIIHFKEYIKTENITNVTKMYNTIRRDLQSTFPNVETIFLTIPIATLMENVHFLF